MLAGYSGYAWLPHRGAYARPRHGDNTRKFQSAGKSVVYPDQPISRLMNQPRLSVSSDSPVPPPGPTKSPTGVMGAKLAKQKEEAAAPRRFVHSPRKRWNSPIFTRRSGLALES